MATERIIIEVSERGSRVVRRQLEGIGTGASKAEGAVSLLKRALGLFGVAVAGRELVHLADTFTNLQNRLRLVATDTSNLSRLTSELMNVANKSRTSYEGTANMYARVALSAKTLGRSQEELIQFTESLNQAVILSGASAREANAGLIQLSQGIASNRLSGDELRSTLEQLPYVADVIAKHMGVTRGELRKMGEDGKISATVVLDAFKAARKELGENFAKTVPTLGQGFQVLANKFMEFVGEAGTASGVLASISRGLITMGENLDNIIPLVVGLGAAFAVWRVGLIISATLGPLIALERALGAATAMSALFSLSMKTAQRAVIGLTTAMMANPFTALATAILTVGTLLWVFSDDIKVTEDGVVNLRDVFVATFNVIGGYLSTFVDYAKAAWNAVASAFDTAMKFLGTTASDVFSALGKLAKAMVNILIGSFVMAYKVIVLTWNNFPAAMDLLFTSVLNLAALAAEQFLNLWQAPLRAIAAGLSVLDEDMGRSMNSALDSAVIQLPRRQASEAGKEFGLLLGEAARDAFTTDYLGNFGDDVMKEARRLAEARGKTGALAPAGPATPVRTETKPDKDELKAQKAFAQWLADLQNETILLGLSNRERERRGMIMEVEARMNRKLTDGEEKRAKVAIAAYQMAKDEDTIRQRVRAMSEENEVLMTNIREREVQAELIRMKYELDRQLTPAEEAWLTATVNQNMALRDQNAILEQLQGPIVEAERRIAALNELYQQGKVSGDLFNRMMTESILSLMSAKVESGSGSLAESFAVQLGQMTEAARNFNKTTGAIFGDFFSTFSQGFGDSIGRAIVYSENLGEALADVARSAVSQLISSLVQLGIQMLLSALLGKALRKAVMAETMAEAAALAAAWAPAASLASLATLGGNAAAAVTAMAGTVAMGQGLAAISTASAIGAMKDGGLVGGSGGPRDDANLTRLSRGEYVVNAAATRRNLGLLNNINSGGSGVQGGNQTFVTVSVDARGRDRPEDIGEYTGLAVERAVRRATQAQIGDSMRPGGALARRSVMTS